MTYQQMCEDIAQRLNETKTVLRFASGRTVPAVAGTCTADDVFNYSPTGELFDIFFWWVEMFPEKFAATLPVDVPNPNVQDMRNNNGVVEIWDGQRWLA